MHKVRKMRNKRTIESRRSRPGLHGMCSKSKLIEHVYELTNLCRFFQNRFVLIIAMTNLIDLRNNVARLLQGDATIFGKKMFVLNPASFIKYLKQLYYFYNNNCQDFIDGISENGTCGNTPTLPGYKEASMDERVKLSNKDYFGDSPWMNLNIKMLFEETNKASNFLLPYYLEGSMNPDCTFRVEDFRTQSLRVQDDRHLASALDELEYMKPWSTKGVRWLSEKEPLVFDAKINFKHVQDAIDKAHGCLENYMASAKKEKQEESVERDWCNRVYDCILKKKSSYSIRKFYYDIHILMAANADTKGCDLPPNFDLFW